jgi:hypothetical protein
LGGEIISLNCCKWLQINRPFLQAVTDLSEIRIHPEAKYINISGDNIAGEIDDGIANAAVKNISGNITVDITDLIPK